MTIEKTIRNLILNYIRIKYNTYIVKNNLTYIDDDKINEVIESLYDNEKIDLIKYINNSLINSEEKYTKQFIENIIKDIFDDDTLCKNRLVAEINHYQKFKQLNNNYYEKSFDVMIKPDSVYGLGLSINIENNNVIIDGFKSTSSGEKLPAEMNNSIKIGHQILELNYEPLLGKSFETIIELFTSLDNNVVIIKLTDYDSS